MNAKFAGTDLAKSCMIVEACIGWHWAQDQLEEGWEHVIAARSMVPLGARPIAPPAEAEAAWLAKVLHKSREAYVLRPAEVIVLRRGPLAIVQFTGIDLATPKIEMRRAVETLEAAAVRHALDRFTGPDLAEAALNAIDTMTTFDIRQATWPSGRGTRFPKITPGM